MCTANDTAMEASRRPLRVFFDTSALIAGSHSRTGAAFALLQLASLGVVDGRISDVVRNEAERNVKAKLPSALPAMRVMIDEVLTMAPGPCAADLSRVRNWADPKDQPIIAAALGDACQFLVTLNRRDFWPPDDAIRVVRPAELIMAIREQVAGLGAGRQP